MPDSEFLGDLKRAKEDEFFYREERIRKEEWQRAAKLEAERNGLAAALGTSDAALLTRLQRLGFTGDNIGLLRLIPLVQVAWADGSMPDAERKEILEAAAAYKVASGSAAHDQLLGWLREPPPTDVFQTAIQAIRSWLSTLPEEQGEAERSELLAQCTRVASASGGFLGLAATSNSESNVLKELEFALGARP